MLIGLQNVTFEFGARVIIADSTWHIQPNERIGLIGNNGTGKSTILKLLVGEYSASEGSVERSRTTSIGYLHQDLLSFDSNDNILLVAMQAFDKALLLEKEIEVLGKELETNTDEKVLTEFTKKLNEFEAIGGYNMNHKTKEVLQGLGFSAVDLTRPYREFSGGWRMRVLLAKIILQQPDILLLDEPTNHLDLPSIEWLEKYLAHYQGSVVIVSHDKYFLNRMVTKIVEVFQQKLHIYSGNYEFYEREKVVRADLQQKAFDNQQDYIRQQERIVERFRAKSSKAAMAQSIIKRLDKLERVEEAITERPQMRINFRMDIVPGKIIAMLKSITKQFGENIIVKSAGAEIERGDKIALIGANGKGKSTLLRIIAGIEPCEGERLLGHNVIESFYAQHQLESLGLDNTIIEEMKLCGSQQTELEIRTLMGCFLFSGDDTDKKLKILSGGEKARVALAKTIVSKANFLMLDEPTNHLDMQSCDLLIEALNKYEGTLILVSHDRYFISKVANKIWEIKDREIKEFKGGYEEWQAWNERMSKNSPLQPAEAKPKPEPVVVAKPAQKVVINKEQKKEFQRQQKLVQTIEEKLNQLGRDKNNLEMQLSDNDTYKDKEKFPVLEKELQQINGQQAKLNLEYEQALELLMAMEENQPNG